MFEPNTKMENAIKFSRFDAEDLLSTCSKHPILLEDNNWLTCEHYFSAKLAASTILAKKIASAASGREANTLIQPWYRPKIRGWKQTRKVLMTRALYTKVQMYDEVKQALLATEDTMIIETSQYDYYWGVGRDLRGENTLGSIWMDIRDKLRQG